MRFGTPTVEEAWKAWSSPSLGRTFHEDRIVAVTAAESLAAGHRIVNST